MRIVFQKVMILAFGQKENFGLGEFFFQGFDNGSGEDNVP